ncbi:hypothetical protein JW877_01520 [bacterium]|nr:hypothetical protein [bacterium]
MKKPILLIILLSFLLSAGMVYAQGCMGGGGDEGLNIAGFFQPEVEIKQTAADTAYDWSFTMRRARIAMFGDLIYDVNYYLCLELSPFLGNPGVLDGIFTYTRFDPYLKISVGQNKSPFSLEQNTACSGLFTIKRSMVVEELAGPQRDLGLWLMGHYNDLVSYNFAVLNGNGMGVRDDNDGKNIVGRVVLSPIEYASLGGSFNMGNSKPTGKLEEDNKITNFGGELQLKYKDFLLQGEYIMGDFKKPETQGMTVIDTTTDCSGTHIDTSFVPGTPDTTKSSGLFVQAMYMTPWNLQPIIKYEMFDPDNNVDNNEYSIITFGFNYFINEWSRIQVNYRYVADYLATDGVDLRNDEILIQFQARFQ